MSEQLTTGEKTILKGLVELRRKSSADEIAKITEQNTERVISILNALAVRGIVKLETREKISYALTDEGKEYARDGLPEIRLVKALEESGRTAPFEVVLTKSGISPRTKGIAMAWAVRNEWAHASKQGDTTILSTIGDYSKSPVAAALESIAKGNGASIQNDDPALQQLLERKLVSEVITKIIEAELSRNYLVHAEDILADLTEDIGNLTPEMLSSGAWKGRKFRPYNVGIQPEYVNYGKKHPYAEFNDWLREIMVGLGFTEWFGPYVETEFWGHDALFVPQDHVARDVQDQFRVAAPYDHGHIIDKKYYEAVKNVHENGGGTGSKGWDWPYHKEVATRLCLRPHTTPVSMRFLYQHRESPQKMFIVDRNFRSESLSVTHAHEFDQCEGIIMDKGLTLRNLLGYLTAICKAVGIEKLKFKPGQFPFTEPSVETFGKHDKLGWIELGGSGIFRPEVTQPLGIRDSVLAWGIGAGRLYMAAMGINDIRDLFSQDLNWLRRSYFVR
ncbi:MAG: phenylalanine--tRNA ligase subunit alpha [Candidatus Thorarchaeota archaeon]|nr:MAG: phenylalanine--tRNA ligase subunit alpha [Candidatus Thorarchaeota archaeon]